LADTARVAIQHDPAAMSTSTESDRIVRAREAVAQNPVWYHTIEVAPGVTTPGRIDLRETASRLLPAHMEGMRALDVGTFDGFWAFSMEARGAEVVAIDVDEIDRAEWPPLARERMERAAQDLDIELGLGFRLVSGLLDSSVKRVISNVYDVTPDVIGGPVDFVFFGALLLHLRDPVRALERVRACLKPGGRLVSMEPFSPWLTAVSPRRPAASYQAANSDFNWWVPNLAGLAAYYRTAGFVGIERLAILRPPSQQRMKQVYAAYAATAPAG
jgi:SAM-dependent methyltransferase